MKIDEVNELGKPWADAIIAQAKEVGLSRSQHQGVLFNEADYLSGVMAAMHGVGLQRYIPAGWVLLIMAGRSVVGAQEHTDVERIKALEAQARSIRSGNFWHAPSEELWKRGNLQVLANGHGGASVYETERDGIIGSRHCSSEDEALALAEWMWDEGVSWESDEPLIEAWVYEEADDVDA